MNAEFLIAEIVDRRKLRRIAIFADQTGYGEGGLKDLSAQLAGRGLQPVYVARFPLGVSSLTNHMHAAREAGADAIVAYTVGPEQAVALKSRAELGMRVPYFAPWALSARSVLENAGPAHVEGTMMVQTIIQDTLNERRASFLVRYFNFSNDRPIGSLMAADFTPLTALQCSSLCGSARSSSTNRARQIKPNVRCRTEQRRERHVR